MHALKLRRSAYGSDTIEKPITARRETLVAAVQILSIGLLSGLCCFMGSMLMLQVLQA